MRYMIAFLAAVMLLVGWAPSQMRLSQSNTTSMLTPTGDLAATDSVNIDTLQFDFENHAAVMLNITADHTSTVTRMDFEVYVSDDAGSSWTKLVEHLDSTLSDVALGATGVMRVGADSTATIFLARPGYCSSADDLTQYLELYNATDIQVRWVKNVGIGAADVPVLTVDYDLYKGSKY